MRFAPVHTRLPGQVVMFSFSTCPFCNKAKALLSDLGARYEALELDKMGKEGLQLRAELAEVGRVRGRCRALLHCARRREGGRTCAQPPAEAWLRQHLRQHACHAYALPLPSALHR